MEEVFLSQVLAVMRPDLEAEYDADRLCQRLVTAAEAEGVVFSSEFKACEIIWRQDELRHYEGFREIWCLVSGQTSEHIDSEMAAVEPDFSDLQDFFGEELAVSVLVVYDELTTVRSYREDMAYYEKLGPEFARWFKLVIADEVCHYSNFLQVIRHNHKGRLKEALHFLDLLIKRDLEAKPYKRTFVLDRRANTFESKTFTEKCGQAVKKALLSALC